MRILCFTDSLVSGGAQRQLVNLAMIFKDLGHEVVFLVYRNIPFYKHYLDEKKIPVILIDARNSINRIKKVYEAICDNSPDIVISFLETPNFISCVSSIKKHKWKLITNELSAKESSFVGIRNKVFKWFERYADWTVCNSQNAREMWIKYWPQYKERLSTIYNPILIPEEFMNHKVESLEFMSLVVPASYQYLKNPIRVIEAYNMLSREEKNRLHVHWYGRKEPSKGETQAYKEAQSLVERYKIEEGFVLHDETNRIYEIMSEANAVGLFSTVEGLPNAICEGMMMGKPVIMSKVSDYDTIVTPQNGLLCDPYSVESIATAFRELLTLSQDERERMGKESKELALKLFSKETVIEQWMTLIQRLLN